MVQYLYLDYGALPQYRRELKYSLISLREAGGRDIAVYTDAPEAYARWPVAVVDIAARVPEWSGGGIYHHRIKPCVALDALARFAGPVCLLDSDSIVRPGFPEAVTAGLAGGAVVMNRFELKNPFPPLKGFRTMLPHLGAYRYDTTQSRMFNSGLIGVSPGQEALLEDALAMIDALIGRARKFPTIEQFALSEVCRLRGTPVVEVKDSFLHYWQGRRRIYMANRIQKTLSPDWDDLTPPKQWAAMSYWAVRAYNYYYGVGHALGLVK